MSYKNKRFVALTLNVAIFIFELFSVGAVFLESGFTLFQYYTNNSNILALISSGCYIVYTIIHLRAPYQVAPTWLKLLKYFSVCMLSITFLIVVLVIAPAIGVEGFFMTLAFETMFYHHLLCPILALVSFIFFELDLHINFKDTFFSLIPLAIYATVIIILNLTRSIIGPYAFLHLYEQPVYVSILWSLLIIVLSYIVAIVLYFISKKTRPKQI